MRRRWPIVLCASLLTLLGATGAAANPYVLTGLGILPGFPNSMATGINGSGQVVGYSEVFSTASCHAFLWQAGTGIQDLNPSIGQTLSFANGINNSGQVVGDSATNANQPFFWQSGSPPQFFGSTGGDAYAINDSGQVVGDSDATRLYLAKRRRPADDRPGRPRR